MSKSKIYGQLVINQDTSKEIDKIISTTNADTEFEFSFYSKKGNSRQELLNMETFLRVIEYLRLRSKIKKEKIENFTDLDMTYVGKDNTNYRLTITGLENIQKNTFSIGKKRNHVAYKILLSKLVSGDKNIKLLKKKRLNVHDIDDYGIRIKSSQETDGNKKDIDMLKKIDEKDSENIIIRYKQRVSLFVDKIRIDLTNVKQLRNLSRIEEANSKYEIEIEHLGKVNQKILEDMFHESELLLKVVNQSNFILSTTEQSQVLDFYNQTFELFNKKKVQLDGRKPISLELIHLLDTLPNKYAVTDKADGDRYFLIIKDQKVYLISNNLSVKFTGLEIQDNKYNGSVLDGEYIFLPKHNRHLFLAFDCLFIGKKDIRDEPSYMNRLKEADKIIENCFAIKGVKPFIQKDYKGNFNPDKIVEFYGEEIKRFNNYINENVNKDKKNPMIMRKVVIGALGGQDNEIYKYADLLWKKYVFDKEINCPYILDGVIFSPLDQKYITSVRDTKYFDYKMKPQSKNSIDMYITFERDPDTGKVLTVFDNSRDEYVKGKPYRIAHLHVGRNTRGDERPVLFQEDSRKYIAHLFLKNGEVRDETGAIIKDKTVVEFYYNTDSGLEDTHRWNPMRTRYDKTEIVNKYKKGYGNYIDVANKVWRSIINPITFNDIETLANDSRYKKHSDFLKSRIDHSLILSEKKENIFNQIRRNLAKPMRNFHNWIRSILIYTYCNQIYEKGNKLSILDIGCGKGEDMMKFYYVMCSFYVGIDKDADSLLSAANGAVSRYNQLRKTHPNFPKYTFVTADASTPLNSELQAKALSSMSFENKKLMDKFFSNDPSKRVLFDRINCQDTIQFLLKDKMTWDGFTENINNYLKEGGYFVFTCFDGESVRSILKDTDKFTAHYNSEKGEKRVLFELIKKYEDDSKTALGNPIDFHSFEEQEGVYVTQYLVDKEFVTKELEEKCGLELVETDLYSNQFKIHSDYFKHIYKYEENEKTKEFFRKVAEFYDQSNSVNQACFKLTKLYRLYVFRKKEKTIKSQKAGGDILEKLDDNLYTKKTVKQDMFSFVNSVTESLINDKFIPKNSSAVEIFGDNYQPDSSLNEDIINKSLKKVEIIHEIDNKKIPVIKGLSVNVLEKDCNGDIIVDNFGLKKNKKTVVLYKTEEGYRTVFDKKNRSLINKKLLDKFD